MRAQVLEKDIPEYRRAASKASAFTPNVPVTAPVPSEGGKTIPTADKGA